MQLLVRATLTATVPGTTPRLKWLRVRVDSGVAGHEAVALSKLISELKDRPGVEALVRGVIREQQEIEIVLQRTFDLRPLATAFGEQLDQWGRVVGRARDGGWPDSTYRALLALQIGVNSSGGQPDTLIQVMSLLMSMYELGTFPVPPTFPVAYEESYPGAVIMTVLSDLPWDSIREPFIYAEIQRVAPGGVRVYPIMRPKTLTTFTYDGGPGTGFQDAAMTLGTGGKYARVIA